MIIDSLKLTNFRCHESYERQFTENTTLLIGPNGCGKTSVLEAIYILLQGRSFRASDSDILRRGSDFYRAEVKFTTGEKTVVIFEPGKGKTFEVSDKKSRRLPQKNRYPVVFFIPSDLNLISHAPGRRRTYFDNLAASVFPDYSTKISRYEKALKQRNELLKSETEITPNDIFSWNLLLARYGSEISKTRELLTKNINESLEPIYQQIAENHDKITLNYQNSTNNFSEESYLKQLELDFPRDRLLGHTSFGIHKDDFIFTFNSNKADGSASRGETRSIIIALKFVETAILSQRTGKSPLIMLDDVFSELDETRRHALVSNFSNHQIIITSVEKIF